MPVDYKKWDHIEVSDDEDDTHPNIDTPSLFRWRHQARMDRMKEHGDKKNFIETGLKTQEQKIAEIKGKIKEAEVNKEIEELEKLKLCESEMEKQLKEFQEKEEELKKEERLTPWNIDTICKEGESKTIINKESKYEEKELTEDEKFELQKVHEKKYEKDMKKFGLFKKYDDSQEFLQDNMHLVCEETANYLILWCIDLCIEEKMELMKHVSHQSIILNFILELARSLKHNPKDCVRPFFSRIKLGEKQYMEAFNDELDSFRKRVHDRAQVRIDKYIKEQEEEDRQARLGPGGLDPVEVFESLPQAMKDCFEKKDIPALQKVIAELKPEDAQYHMKRCIDSGMWVAGKDDNNEEVEEADNVDSSCVDGDVDYETLDPE